MVCPCKHTARMPRNSARSVAPDAQGVCVLSWPLDRSALPGMIRPFESLGMHGDDVERQEASAASAHTPRALTRPLSTPSGLAVLGWHGSVLELRLAGEAYAPCTLIGPLERSDSRARAMAGAMLGSLQPWCWLWWSRGSHAGMYALLPWPPATVRVAKQHLPGTKAGSRAR